METQQRGAVPAKVLVAFAIIGILSIPFLLLPKGFKGDLTLVGQGLVSIVLAYDNNLVGTTDTMELLNLVRPDYQQKVQFLAVDIATPDGIRFIQEQRIRVLELVIFAPDGTTLQVLPAGSSEFQLRSNLERALEAAGK